MINPTAIVGFLLATLSCIPAYGKAQTDPSPAREPEVLRKLREEIREGFYSRINLVAFGLMQDLPRTPLNPIVDLDFARYQTELDVRPDFRLNFRRLELGLKPRVVFQWRKCNLDPCESETEVEPYIQEWLIRYRIADPLFVSYGRQNLQWGPSYLLSPSNPFNANNGRNNPQLEVPSLDYGRIVWIPSAAWALSGIANTDKGRAEPLINTFKKTYAIKFDYTGQGKYFSLIPSYREDEEYRLGFFGGWSVSDALLLHVEGDLSDQRQNPRALIGASYTLALGPTLTVEYFRNQDGCTKEPIPECSPLDFSADFREGFLLRKNYLLLQYLQTRIMDVLHVTARWIRNLDDGSNRFVGIVDYELGNRTELFFVGNVLEGDRQTEFGGLLGYSLMLGVKFTF